MSSMLSGLVAILIVGAIYGVLQYRVGVLSELIQEQERQALFLQEARMRLIQTIDALREREK